MQTFGPKSTWRQLVHCHVERAATVRKELKVCDECSRLECTHDTEKITPKLTRQSKICVRKTHKNVTIRFYRAIRLAKDHFKKYMRLVFLVHIIFVFICMNRVANLADPSSSERFSSNLSTRSFGHRKWRFFFWATECANIFSRVGSRTLRCIFFVLIWNNHLHVRMSCFAFCLITHFSRCSTTKTVVAWSRTFLGLEKSHAETVAWSFGMEGHAKKWAEIYCEVASKKEQLYEVPSSTQRLLFWRVTGRLFSN